MFNFQLKPKPSTPPLWKLYEDLLSGAVKLESLSTEVKNELLKEKLCVQVTPNRMVLCREALTKKITALEPEPLPVPKPNPKPASVLAISRQELGIRLACGSGALACMIVSVTQSIDFTSLFFAFPANWIVSAVLPVFTTFTLEASILVRKYRSYLLSFVLVLLFAFGATYETIAVAISQYNSRIESLQKTVDTNIGTISADIVLEQLLSDKAQLLNQLADATSGLKAERERLEAFPEEAIQNRSYQYREQERRYDKAVTKKAELETKLATLTKEITKATLDSSQTVTASRPDAYQWIGTQLKLSVSTVEFWMFAILATFLIVAAPVGMFVALGLWKNN